MTIGLRLDRSTAPRTHHLHMMQLPTPTTRGRYDNVLENVDALDSLYIRHFANC